MKREMTVSGTFYPKDSLISGNLTIKQSYAYMENRLVIAKSIVLAISKNIHEVLYHYYRHGTKELKPYLDWLKKDVVKFLEKELDKLKKELAAVDAKIADFKEKHINELPALLQLNIQSLQNLELKQEGLQENLLQKKERREFIKLQLANMPEASKDITDQKKLEELETHLAKLRSQYTETYPDVVSLKAEISELRRKIAEKPVSSSNGTEYIDNPTYVNLKGQLSSIDSEINSLQRQIAEYSKKAEDYRKRIETSLRVEEEYKSLIMTRDNTQAKYSDLMHKLMEAKVSFGLEEEQKGERFTLIDAANYPEAPYKPNRLMIIMLGFVAGITLGTGMVALQEYGDHSIRDVDMLAQTTGFPVLGSIPVVVTKEDIARNKKQRMIILLVIIIGIVCALGALNYFFSAEVSQLLDKILQPQS